MNEIDPNEICLHCGRKISGRYRQCEFCGELWYEKTETEDDIGKEDSKQV